MSRGRLMPDIPDNPPSLIQLGVASPQYSHKLVISATIANFNVQRILIDNRSYVDIMFISAFDKMKIGLDKLHPFHSPLVGFGGNTTHPLGWIKFSSYLGNRTPSNHYLVGFHCGGLSFALQRDPRLPNVRRNKGYLFYLPPKNEVSHVNMIFRLPSDQNVKLKLTQDQIQAVLAMSSPRNIHEILERPDTSGRLLKWSIELSEFNIDYKLKMAIKAKALANFVAKLTHDVPEPRVIPPKVVASKEQDPDEDLTKWKLFLDGSFNQHGYGAGLVLQISLGEQMEYAIRIGFKATNNEVEI
ncbi:hypothetical protein Acr_00g0072680 [Actinidia rufa]|uniref:Uncharacterized protein n=1 Tax=Actinidia rufa TaxID=165716 RepID=A0A7J0DSC5_9ERIC|nr:hypothetical protein Acr_00g0072680 [Actinidia rufa]